MRVPLLALASALAAAAAASPSVYYLPQIADGPAALGSFKTTILATNNGAAAANLTIAFTRDDGSPRSLTLRDLGSGSTLSFKLAPGASRSLVTDGSSDGSSSAAVITSDAPVDVSAIVTYSDGGGVPVGESATAALTATDLAYEYRVPIDTTNGTDSGVALYNPSPAPVQVTLQLLGVDPASGGTTVTLPPRGRRTLFTLGDLFPGVGDFKGTMSVAAPTSAIAATALRMTSSIPSYRLLPAAFARSRRLKLLLGQIADGQDGAVTRRTTFVLTNLSAQPATVDLTLYANDGTLLTLNIPGIDNNSDFEATIDPGATVFWQTDGMSPAFNLGSARIRSDQPLAAAAVITAFDGGTGVVVGETAVAPSAPGWQLAMPFDTAAGTLLAGAAISNTGNRPVAFTLALQDASGKTVASSSPDPLAPGARLTGTLADLFPAQPALPANGAIIVTAGPTAASLTALSFRQSPAGEILSSAPAIQVPRATPAAPPATVVAKLDATRVATATIPTTGGSFSLTDAKGNRFTLTLPPGALLNRETITMTAIASATGISAPGLTAGVQLEPDGLALLAPALLKIDLASPAPTGVVPIGWRGGTPGVYLNVPLRDPNSLTLTLTHFSGAGAGGFDLTSELLKIANDMDFYQSKAAEAIARGRQQVLAGDADGAAQTNQELNTLFDDWYANVVEPLMELAEASDDADVMRCAATVVIGYQRQLQLTGAADDESYAAQVAATSDFISYILSRATQKLVDRCNQHDFTVYYDLIGAFRQTELMGGTPPSVDIQGCLPRLELTYKSNINGIIPVGVGGTFDSTISAKVTLTGNFTKDMLTQITDPSKDLLTSFTLSGSGPETYDSMTLTVNELGPGCSVSIPSKTADTLTVKPGADPQLSQVQFKFNPHYEPQALTRNQVQLCSFCPVYRKTPVKVDLWLDPGKPSETILMTCPGGALPLTVNFWWTGWATNHASAGDLGFITGWTVNADPSFSASKDIRQSVVGPSATLRETTNLTLKPKTQ